MKNKYSFIPLVVCLSACTTGNWYSPSTNETAATVTFETTDRVRKNIGVVKYEGEEYLESKGAAVTILNSWIPTYKYSNSHTTKVNPNVEFRFSIKSGDIKSEFQGNQVALVGEVCMKHKGFIPKENGKYKVIFTSENKKCILEIYEFTKNEALGVVASAKNYKSCIDTKLGGKGFTDAICPAENFNFR